MRRRFTLLRRPVFRLLLPVIPVMRAGWWDQRGSGRAEPVYLHWCTRLSDVESGSRESFSSLRDSRSRSVSIVAWSRQTLRFTFCDARSDRTLAHVLSAHREQRWATQPRAIGIDEETAVLVLPNGAGSMVGVGAAYFLQAPGPAQVLADKTPLTYLNIGVYKVPQGATFNLSTWTGTGGVAYTLNVNNGSVTSTQAGGNIY